MIVVTEIRKIITSPVLWCIALVFVAFNIAFIWSSIGDKKAELKETYNNIQEGELNEYAKEESKARYEKLDMVEIKNVKLEMMTDFHPKGKFKKFIDNCYEKLNKRVEEIIKNKEAEGVFYPGQYFRMHNKLFSLFRMILQEMALIMSLAVLYLMDYERIHKTEEIIYSGKVGRNIQKAKLFSGILVGLLFGIILMGISLAIFFSQVSYQGLWNVSLSAALAMEPRGIFLYPYITFSKMTIGQNIIAAIGIGILLIIIVGLMAGSLYLIIKNSYYSFAVEALILVAFLVIGSRNTSTWLDIPLSLTPTILWYQCGAWFTENDVHLCFKGYELLSIGVQFFGVMIVTFIGKRLFAKSDF